MVYFQIKVNCLVTANTGLFLGLFTALLPKKKIVLIIIQILLSKYTGTGWTK